MFAPGTQARPILIKWCLGRAELAAKDAAPGIYPACLDYEPSQAFVVGKWRSPLALASRRSLESVLGDRSNREQRRSERVKLSIPVIVLAETREREQVQEETVTSVVNAHGGLFKLKMEVLVGQPIVVVNPLTNKEESCRVVRVDELPSGGFGVAFAFDTPAPDFWPLTTPPLDWNLVRS